MRIVLLASAAGLLLGATAPAERVVSGDGVVDATVGGVVGRLRIDPGATAMPILTAALAGRAGLKGGWIAVGYTVGPEVVSGRTAVTRLTIGSTELRRRVSWTDRPYTTAADGAIGPGGLPEPVIRFRRRDALPGARTVALPMVTQGGMVGGWGELFARIEVGGLPMRVRFDPYRPRTLATAAAATRIARAHDGTLSGEPGRVALTFGIERPVRAMRLAQPLGVGPLRITALGVRTADFGSAATIREEGADPDEVVVSAGKKRDPGRDRLSIGADLLERCSEIVYDKPAKLIRLTCA